jgi:hypothetical protein
MLKKLSLVVLFGISNLHATDVSPKTGFIEKVKNSPAIVKVVGGIIPCIVAFISMDAVMRTYKDNPEKLNIVNIAYHIKWISLIIASVFGNLLLRINFRNWITPAYTEKSINNINTPNELSLT